MNVYSKSLSMFICTWLYPVIQWGLMESLDGGGYQFLDRNGWPVSSRQEHCLAVMDVLCNSVVKVRPAPGMTLTPLDSKRAGDCLPVGDTIKRPR